MSLCWGEEFRYGTLVLEGYGGKKWCDAVDVPREDAQG